MVVYSISSILIILGLIAIAVSGGLPADNWAIPYLNELASALLVGGLLSILFRVFHDRGAESRLRRLLRIHDSVDELGLVEICAEVQDFNYTELIRDRDNLCVVMNDGLRWIGNNAVALQERFSRRSTTEFFLVDPESPFVSSLATKVGVDASDLKKKIQDSWSRLRELYAASGQKGTLCVYKLKTFPTRSLFLTEQELVETPYQTASGRARIPLYLYRKVARADAPFYFAQSDVDACRNESSLELTLPATPDRNA